MNPTATDLDELPATDRAFAALARQRLRATESLDYVESARLAAAAVGRSRHSTPRRGARPGCSDRRRPPSRWPC